MTDTILSPNGVESSTFRVVVVPGLGAVAPVGSLTPAEVQALKDSVNAVLSQNLGDLANVDETGKATGMPLVVLADGTWGPGSAPGFIESVYTNWNSNQRDDVTFITVGRGIDVNTSVAPANRAHLELVWGASGSSNVIARADHTHPPTLVGRFVFDKGGVTLGGGSNTLVDETVSGLVSSVTYDVHIVGRLEGVNSNLSGRLKVLTQIGSYGDQGLVRGFSGGVWTDVSVDGTRMSVTGVTSLRLQFWAEYLSGDPTNLYTGSLVYSITPRGGQQ